MSLYEVYLLIALLFLVIDSFLLFFQREEITLADLLCSIVFAGLWFPIMLSYLLTRLFRFLFSGIVIWRKSI
mgnify:CR=1 FL=1